MPEHPLRMLWRILVCKAAQLCLRNNGVAYRLDLDHTILKDEGIHSIGDTAFHGAGSPLQEEDILYICCLDVPLCLGKSS